MNAPRKPEACKSKYAKQKKIAIKYKDRKSAQKPKGAKERQHCAISWFARRSTPITNKCGKRGRELKREALHKSEVCEAKHTHTTNKTLANGKGTE